MTGLKRSKSIDFALPVRCSAAFPPDFDLERLKTFRSCPNIQLEATRDSDRAEDAEWLNTIKSMIDSWVQKMNEEMQKTELQVMCLEDLQTHYSQQMDMIIINNRSLSNELRVATKKLKAVELKLNDEKRRQKILSDRLNASESSYNNLLSANTILFQHSKVFANKNNVVGDDDQELLDNLYDVYRKKNNIFVKLSKERNDLGIEKISLRDRFKSIEISLQRELKQIVCNNMTLKTGIDDILKNHKPVVDNIKTMEENIDKMKTDQENQQEEREKILEDIVRVENAIEKKSQIKTIILDKLKMFLEEIVPFKI